MKRYLYIFTLIILCMIYFIPIIIIGVLAYVCLFLGISKDLTSTKPIVFFIKPITYIEGKIFRK